MRIALLLAACILLMGCDTLSGLLKPAVTQEAAALRPGAYSLDPDHAALTFALDHMGLSTFKGRFGTLEASLDFNEADPAAARLDVVIDMTSLDVGNSDFREKLAGGDWFDVESFPEAQFTSTAIEVTGPASGTVTGDLTLHGVTAPVTLAVTFNGGALVPLTGDYTLGFDAEGTFLRSTFGLGRYSALVSDEVAISFSGEFRRD